MEVEATEEGEINDEAGEEVVMEDSDYAELKNKFVKPKKMGVRPRVIRKDHSLPTVSPVKNGSPSSESQIPVRRRDRISPP
jgi:hypothetical protein